MILLLGAETEATNTDAVLRILSTANKKTQASPGMMHEDPMGKTTLLKPCFLSENLQAFGTTPAQGLSRLVH